MDNKMEKQNLVPVESKLKYNDNVVEKSRKFLEFNLKEKSKTVKDFQSKLSNLLEKK